MDLLEKNIHYSTKSPFHGTLGTSWLRSWRGFGPHHTARAPRLHGDFKAKSRSDVVGSHHNISIIHLCICVYLITFTYAYFLIYKEMMSEIGYNCILCISE